MKPTVREENLGREGKIKEKIEENDTGRKLEFSRIRNSTESDIRESLALSNLIDSNIMGGEGGEVDKPRCYGECEKTERGRKRISGQCSRETAPLSGASTSVHSGDVILRWTVKGDKRQAGHHHGYKCYTGTMLTSVFKLTLRMQAWVKILITACILSMVSLAPYLTNKERRPSKYKVQMFDCGVPGKMQVFQKGAVMIPTREGQVH